MPVPTYEVIQDSEIDPESPITSSLMRRLRDNVCALFGIDPSDSSPSPTVPASYMAKAVTQLSATSDDAETSEFTLSDPVVSGEDLVLLPGVNLFDNMLSTCKVDSGGLNLAGAGYVPLSLGTALATSYKNETYGGDYKALISAEVSVAYTDGVPTAVSVHGRTVTVSVEEDYVSGGSGVSSSYSSFGPTSIPITNSYTNLVTDFVQMKCRTSGGLLLARFRSQLESGWTSVAIRGMAVRKYIVSKGA